MIFLRQAEDANAKKDIANSPAVLTKEFVAFIFKNSHQILDFIFTNIKCIYPLDKCKTNKL
ncbi:hypothetical protein D7004_12620 [Pedobacter jejuensis]|uniref:Uncharacterized protein n=1 Tax=Pedobacter jejuensis TaxID=1268550 RepID=A0A3N0BTP9_9SPHI|nr:hypothetical protein D7004_12620 [Pedobacter jejuensis]